MKVLVRRNLFTKFESLTLKGSKDIAQVKVFENRSNSKVKVTRSKVKVANESPC